MSLPLLMLRRIGRHVTRTRARSTWVLLLICIVIYLGLPFDVTKQFAIVLASVAAGAIFLPDLNSALWEMSAEDIRGTIPKSRVEALQRELIASQVAEADGWTDTIWHQGLRPLMQASNSQRGVYRSVRYDVRVSLRRPVTTPNGPAELNRIRTHLHAQRTVPDQERLCISIARDNIALLGEFSNPSCVGRELVSLPSVVGDASDVAWQAAVKASCGAYLAVGGALHTLVNPECAGPVMRYWLDTPEGCRGQKGSITCEVDFVEEMDARSFPVIFGHYYCLGATQISFTLEKNGYETRLHAVEFFARGLDCPAGSLEHRVDGRLDTEIVRYASPPDSLLWPGSGVLLHWDVERMSH